jgi:hypothetical protein
MGRRIGFIQTRGIGDIIIALPIADYYEEAGWNVSWPIDASFLKMFQAIKPTIEFIPVDRAREDIDYFQNDPIRLLLERRCDRIVNLYSAFGGMNVVDARLSSALKVDEYKYAVAGVPFERKWQLEYERDLDREKALFEKLKIKGDYVCVHDRATYMASPFEIPHEFTRGLEVVKISPITDSLFDWRLTLERATRLVMVNSSFANFVEPLGLTNDKILFLGEPAQLTPVFASGWRFVFPKPAI